MLHTCSGREGSIYLKRPISIFPFPEDDEFIVGSNCSGDTNCNDERTDSGIVMTALRISGSREIISLLFPDFSA